MVGLGMKESMYSYISIYKNEIFDSKIAESHTHIFI
jgi:hypothetical protein